MYLYSKKLQINGYLATFTVMFITSTQGKRLVNSRSSNNSHQFLLSFILLLYSRTLRQHIPTLHPTSDSTQPSTADLYSIHQLSLHGLSLSLLQHLTSSPYSTHHPTLVLFLFVPTSHTIEINSSKRTIIHNNLCIRS